MTTDEAVPDRCAEPTVRTPRISGKLVDELQDLCEENFFACYQCGTCAAGCPFIEDMDLTPDDVIRHVVMDDKSVLDSKTIWLCSSCFVCAERCPRDINITKIMEAIRHLVLRKNIDVTDMSCVTEGEKKTIPQLVFVSLFRRTIG